MSHLLTPTNLSKELQVPLPTIYQWRSKGVGPRGIRIGKHLRYKREDVDAWLEERADQHNPKRVA